MEDGRNRIWKERSETKKRRNNPRKDFVDPEINTKLKEKKMKS